LRQCQVIVVEDEEIHLRETDIRVIKAFKRNGGQASTRELFYETKMDEAYLWEKVKYLMELGLVVRVKRGWYKLTEKGQKVAI